MIRKISKLKNAQHVSYFQWPMINHVDEDGSHQEFESFNFTRFNLQKSISALFPEFKTTEDWVTDEDVVILRGYGVEIGMASNRDVGSLSIRVDDEDIYDVELHRREQWVEDNWDKISQNHSNLRVVGQSADGKLNLYKVSHERINPSQNQSGEHNRSRESVS